MGQPAYASSVAPYSGGCDVCVAGAAVDGRTADPRIFFRSFNYGDLNPWFSVDLGATATVHVILLYFRLDCCVEATGGWDLRVGNTSVIQPEDAYLIRDNPLVWEQTQPGEVGGVLRAELHPPAVGRWVVVQNHKVYDRYIPRGLAIVELEVYGVLEGKPVRPSIYLSVLRKVSRKVFITPSWHPRTSTGI
jgi:hypothetical protein